MLSKILAAAVFGFSSLSVNAGMVIDVAWTGSAISGFGLPFISADGKTATDIVPGTILEFIVIARITNGGPNSSLQSVSGGFDLISSSGGTFPFAASPGIGSATVQPGGLFSVASGVSSGQGSVDSSGNTDIGSQGSLSADSLSAARFVSASPISGSTFVLGFGQVVVEHIDTGLNRSGQFSKLDLNFRYASPTTGRPDPVYFDSANRNGFSGNLSVGTPAVAINSPSGGAGGTGQGSFGSARLSLKSATQKSLNSQVLVPRFASGSLVPIVYFVPSATSKSPSAALVFTNTTSIDFEEIFSGTLYIALDLEGLTVSPQYLTENQLLPVDPVFNGYGDFEAMLKVDALAMRSILFSFDSRRSRFGEVLESIAILPVPSSAVVFPEPGALSCISVAGLLLVRRRDHA